MTSSVHQDSIPSLPFINPALTGPAVSRFERRAGVQRPAAALMRPSTLAARLITPGVQISDTATMFAALVLTLGDTPFSRGQTLPEYLGARASAHNLAIACVLLVLWRITFWLTGIYEPRLSRRAAAVLWRLPLTTALSIIPVFPVLTAKRLAGQLPHSSYFFFVTASVLSFTVRACIVAYGQWPSRRYLPGRAWGEPHWS